MATIYYDADANLDLVKDKTIAILGYGNQGSSQAMNMRDNGIRNIIVGNRKDTAYGQANADGFPVYSIEEASRLADVIFVLLPDEAAPEIFQNQIRPNLKAGDILNFATGYNITYRKIDFPDDVDIVMAAPRMIGKGVRDTFLSGEGYLAFVSVAQDYSGRAKEHALALCKAIGATKRGAIEVTFDDETYLDLMTEKAFAPMIFHAVMQSCDFLTEMGHPEEAVLIETYLSGELAYTMEKSAEIGVFKQLAYHSNTSQYAQLLGVHQFDPTPMRQFLQKQYESIRSGTFAEEWTVEQEENNLSNLARMMEEAAQTNIAKAEERIKARRP